jgi:hypothetical protein
MPPVEALSSPAVVDNPIELAHQLALDYATAYRNGVPRINP